MDQIFPSDPHDEKWSIEQLFASEHSPHPFFERGPEEMYLWECDNIADEAHIVYRGYDHTVLRSLARKLQKNAKPGITYCVEFPNRKGHRDAKPQEKRKWDGPAKCLPNPKQRMLVTMVENRWGATLDESVYMKSRGAVKQFYMRSDKTKTPVFTFDTWDEVQQMAFAPRK